MTKTVPSRRRRVSREPTNVIEAAASFRLRKVDGWESDGWFAFWRRFPAQTIAPMADSVAADLGRISAIDPTLREALKGEETSAIRLAIDLQGQCAPFSPTTDLAMTALMLFALRGSAAAAMVMVHVIKSCRFEHDRGPYLTGSWMNIRAINTSRSAADRRRKARNATAALRITGGATEGREGR